MEMFKPLIFIYPLSPTLQKLKEVKEEVAEEEKIELYECDMVQEAGQLIGSVGPSVCFVSDAKKCAQILLANKKQIKKLGTKILLLVKEDLPRDTFLKLQKMGLTELIVEPVPPKSLIFKSNILIKALPDPAEMFETKKEEKTPVVKSVEPLFKTEEKELEVKKQEEISLNFEDKKESTEKKKDSELNLAPADKKAKEASPELKLEEAKKEKVQTKDGPKDEAPEVFDLEDDLFDPLEDYDDEIQTSSDTDLKIQQAKKPEEKKTPELNLKPKDKAPENKASNTPKEGAQKIGQSEDTPLFDTPKVKEEEKNKELELSKAKVKSKEDTDLLPKDNATKKEDKSNLELAPEKKSIGDSKNDDLELSQKPKSTQDDQDLFGGEGQKKEKDKTNLDIKSAPSRVSSSSEPELTPIKPKDNEKTDLNINETPKKLESIDELELDKLKPKEEEKTNLDIKSATAKVGETDSDDDEGPQKIGDSQSELSLSKSKEEEEEKTELNLAKGLSKSSSTDEEEKEKAQKLESSKELDLEKGEKPKSEKTDLDLAPSVKELDSNLDIQDSKRKAEEHSDLDLQGGKVASKEDSQLNIESSEKKLKEIERKELQSLGREKAQRKVDDNWDFDKKKKEEVEEDWSQHKEVKEEEIKKEKAQIEETTINYGQLFKEFSTSINQSKSEDEENKNKSKEEDNEEEEIEAEQVYQADSKGLEHAVEMLELLMKKDTKQDDIFSFTSEKIKIEVDANVTFYHFNKEKKELEKIYSSIKQDSPILENWMEIQKEGVDQWKNVQIPTFEDNTFQSEGNKFIYPYFEGITQLGAGVIYFDKKFSEDKAKTVEVLMEICRHVYLQSAREAGLGGQYKGAAKKEPEKKGGFLSKLFKGAS